MKAARLLAILSRLQARGTATAEELAAAHEVSVRTIYRDIDALSAAGFPVYGDPGPGGGFRLLDVPTQRITSLVGEEAEAMLLVGLPGPAAALGMGRVVASVRDKLLLRLSGPAQQQAEKLARAFHLDPDDWYRSAEANPNLPLLTRAILDERSIRFRYRSWTRERKWTASPLGIVLKGGHFYLIAATEKGPTTFRVAAIANPEPAEMPYQRPPDFNLARWWHQSLAAFEARLRPHRAQVLLTEVGAQRLGEAGHYAERAIQCGEAGANGLLVDLPFETIDQAARLLLGIGPEFRVLAPDALRRRVRELALAMAKRQLA